MSGILLTPITVILSAYLALTNSMADGLTTLLDLPTTETVSHIEQTVEDIDEDVEQSEEKLSKLPSRYEYGGTIPDILIQNAAYQKAAVIESSLEVIEEMATSSPEEALVNVYCTYTSDDTVRTTTGSGFFVNENGVLLTNAHVAQLILLNDVEDMGKTECIIRTGAIATPSYKVDLLYISPAWIQDNASVISQAEPKGTGERDYALLYVTEGLDNSPIPVHLPYLPAHTELLPSSVTGATVSLGGYPANHFFTEGPEAILNRRLATTTVADLFTFGSNYADIFYLHGSSVGEQGVSGGPIINEAGQAIGMISTRSNDTELGVGSLNAITLSYIHRTMLEETGFGFADSTTGNLAYRSEIFKSTLVPFLSAMLVNELGR